MPGPDRHDDLLTRAAAAVSRAAELGAEHESRRDAATEMLEATRLELAEAREKINHLEIALRTNRRIAMAVGIIMARHALTEEAALASLADLSQRTRRKLRDVAEDVVYLGDYPTVA